MGKNDIDSTGGTSRACASGNPPVFVSLGSDQPEFMSNDQVLAHLLESGFSDANSPEASYLLEHISYQHLLPYLRVAKKYGTGEG